MSVVVKIVSQFDPKGVRRAEGSLDGLTRSAKVAGAAFAAAAAGIAVGLGKAVQAAAEDQKSFEQLAQSMRNLTGASDAFIGQMDKQIGRMSMASGIADDKLRPAFANLLRATGSVTLSQKGLTAAMDLAVATGRDLDSVSLAVGKALNGQTTALFKLLPGLRGVVDEGSSAEEILAAINSQVGGAAQANTQTFAGSLERMKVIFGEMVETVGGLLLPALTRLADFLNTYLTTYFTYLSDTVGPAVSRMFGSIGDVIRTDVVPVMRDYLVPAFQFLFGLFRDKVLPALEKIGALLVDKVGAAFAMLSDKLEKNRDSFGRMRDTLERVAVFVERYVIPVYIAGLGKALDAVIKGTGFVIDAMVKLHDIAVPIVATVGKVVGGVIRGIVNGINAATDAINFFIGAYNSLPGFLKPFGDVSLLPKITLPDFDFTNYKPGGFGYFGDNRGAMGAPAAGGLDLGLGSATATGGSSGGRAAAPAPVLDPLAGMTPEQIKAGFAAADFFSQGLDNPVVRRGQGSPITVNVTGGLATSADVGRAVVDALKQYTNVSGPADIAVA